MSFEFIDKVGLEIEGCWPYPRNDLVADGSLREFEFKKPFIIQNDTKVSLFGELVSIPLSHRDEIISFLNSNWVSETGNRCGYHIHFSLKDFTSYCVCMKKEFLEEFLTFIREWAIKNKCEDFRFFERLDDRNKFCRIRWIPDTQVAIVKKVVSDERRYCIFNHCWGMHKTIECRLFPTFFDVKLAISATLATIDFIEDFIKRNQFIPSKMVDEETVLLTEDKYEFSPFSFFSRKPILYKRIKNSPKKSKKNVYPYDYVTTSYNLFEIKRREMEKMRKSPSITPNLRDVILKMPDMPKKQKESNKMNSSVAINVLPDEAVYKSNGYNTIYNQDLYIPTDVPQSSYYVNSTNSTD